MLPAARRPGAGEQPAGRMRESANGVDPWLVERVRSALAAEPGVPSPARVAAALRSEGTVLGDSAVLEVTELLRAEIAGAGPLDALLREPGVTDVLVNAPDTVWVDRGHGLERSPVRLRDEAAVRRLAQRLPAPPGAPGGGGGGPRHPPPPRRGPRRRGGRPPGGPEHRPRGRLRHASRELGRRRPRAPRGARCRRRAPPRCSPLAGRRCPRRRGATRPGAVRAASGRRASRTVPVAQRRAHERPRLARRTRR